MCIHRNDYETPYEVYYLDFDMEDFCCFFEADCVVWDPAAEYSNIIKDDFCGQISVPDDFCVAGETSKEKLCSW